MDENFETAMHSSLECNDKEERCSTGFSDVNTVFSSLRRQVYSSSLSFLMEAHNGLSAKIVEEAGFSGIWASGLTISASQGLRDSNEASWTQVLDNLEYMADATALPILMDGDTGYGNFNNVRRLVRKLCQRRIAGVCIEDKLFPKTNSFIGELQPLAGIQEFCGKLKAGKDSQTDDDFVLVARVEALISGRSIEEALERAHAYVEAGADAILIHSKKPSASEIIEFSCRWANRAPLVVVPTTYYATPTDRFQQAGISTVIWANHLLRASIGAMRQTATRIYNDRSLQDVESQIAGLRDVFHLAGNAELAEAEKRYLPEIRGARAIVLAASRGDLDELTQDRPKCMIDVRGQSLLQRLISTLSNSGIHDVTVIRGYRKEAVSIPGAKTVDNDDFESTGESFSLSLARDALDGEIVVTYGDILFPPYVLDSLLASGEDVVIAVDGMKFQRNKQKKDLVIADRRCSNDCDDGTATFLSELSSGIASDEADGEWMGLARFSPRGSVWLREEVNLLEAEGLLSTSDLPSLLTRMAIKHPVAIRYFSTHWTDVNTLADLATLRNRVL